MIPQAELDRALARWKARKLGLSDAPTPAPVTVPALAAARSDGTVVTAQDEIEVGSGLIAISEYSSDDEPR